MSLNSDTKRTLLDILKRSGIISDNFTGKLTLNVNNGSICDIERIEKLR